MYLRTGSSGIAPENFFSVEFSLLEKFCLELLLP
jgi:hypothetical protein